ncbi:MAG: acetate--CoA ligase family protein [Alteraurantiacibacter sp. bin_em_oilr2.035]|uniref:acetate--CoA ligase family protein n=1 Tax=Aurantiacibacter atlanticus TaxID=1648404 RepID=UPI0009EF0590|nr:acetate--CoA ligase family protein [Aurantiacibacter atlanticus]MDF1834311.1 acetate--CoA ligase family protein [Alteraurantiacibacter sp. bin_em_oilr2.035]
MTDRLPSLEPHWLRPSRIVLVGASQETGSVGHAVLTNLLREADRFELHAVNPHKLVIPGAHCHTGIQTVPPGPALAVIAIPARLVPDVLRKLAAKGIGLAVIISAGLGKTTEPGQEMLRVAREAGIRIIGPNCLGIILPHMGINASFASHDAPAGELALLSQSGAIASAMVEWAAPHGVGFSAILSIGDMAQTGFDELLELLAADPQTRAILIYMEGLDDGRAFVKAARAVTAIKPVIVLKAGRGTVAGRAALSHTGALAGSWEVYRAAFHEAGIVTASSLDALFDAAAMLDDVPELPGERLAIVTNGGGAGVLALDAMEVTSAPLAELSDDTVSRLDAVLPPGWSRANPVDIIGDAGSARYRAAMEAVLADDGVDAVLAMNCPTGLLMPGEAARAVADAAGSVPRKKPVIACWLGDANRASSHEVLGAARIPEFSTPAQAIRAFGYATAARWARVQILPDGASAPDVDAIVRGDAIIDAVLADNRHLLSEIEAKGLLAAFGIPVVSTQFAATAELAEQACTELPAPYAIKIVSPDITHKSDFGGVVLGLADAAAVRQAARAMAKRIATRFPEARIEGFAIQPMIRRKAAHELFAGIACDPSFGPVILFGAGGTAIEVIDDKSIALPPVHLERAKQLIGETRIARLLSGYRNVPATDQTAVAEVIAALSNIALALPRIAELDINPLIADADGVVALDARVVLRK